MPFRTGASLGGLFGSVVAAQVLQGGEWQAQLVGGVATPCRPCFRICAALIFFPGHA